MNYVMTPDISRDLGPGRSLANGHQAPATPEDQELLALALSVGRASTRAELEALRRAYRLGVERGREIERAQARGADVFLTTLLDRGLTATEARIVSLLVAHEGELVHSNRIQAAVWGPEGGYSENILRSNMSRLRHKLAGSGWCIDTLIGFGYRAHRWDGADARCPRSDPRMPHDLAALPPESRDELLRLRAAGWSCLRLGREFGRREKVIRRWLAELEATS